VYRQGGDASTVPAVDTEVGRAYAPDLATPPAELSDEQAVDMAGRLRLARIQGVGDERRRRMAAKALTMDDRPRAREAADIWLTFREGTGGPEASAA
jgi:hypothetical protein